MPRGGISSRCEWMDEPSTVQRRGLQEKVSTRKAAFRAGGIRPDWSRASRLGHVRHGKSACWRHVKGAGCQNAADSLPEAEMGGRNSQRAPLGCMIPIPLGQPRKNTHPGACNCNETLTPGPFPIFFPPPTTQQPCLSSRPLPYHSRPADCPASPCRSHPHLQQNSSRKQTCPFILQTPP